MKKDLDKLYSRTIVTYFTILFIIFVLKLFGLNYFGIDTDNKIIQDINSFVVHWYLEKIWYTITLFINTFIILAITCDDKSKKMLLYTLCVMPLCKVITYIENVLGNGGILVIIDLLYLFILSLCYIKFIKKEKIHRYNVGNYFLFVLIINVYQVISMLTRNIDIKITNDFIISTILSLDYLVLCLMTLQLYFIKGGKSLWIKVHGSSLVLLTSLKTLPTRFLKSYQESKPEKKDDELAYKIYIVLFWLYNFFTIAVILLIAFLNDTFIECIFISIMFLIFSSTFSITLSSTIILLS